FSRKGALGADSRRLIERTGFGGEAAGRSPRQVGVRPRGHAGPVASRASHTPLRVIPCNPPKVGGIPGKTADFAGLGQFGWTWRFDRRVVREYLDLTRLAPSWCKRRCKRGIRPGRPERFPARGTEGQGRQSVKGPVDVEQPRVGVDVRGELRVTVPHGGL